MKIGFDSTLGQKLACVYLRYSRLVTIWLLVLHHRVADWAINQHPCWAGGFGPEGVEKQNCDACDPFYREIYWLPSNSETRRYKPTHQ